MAEIKFNYIIGIDPAGKGETGIVIYDNIFKNIVDEVTLVSDSDEQAVKQIFDYLFSIHKSYKIVETYIKPIVIIESAFISQKITNPLSTPMCIGGIKALLNHIFKWKFVMQAPNVKKNFTYKGNIKMSEHELDVWKHIQYFLAKE